MTEIRAAGSADIPEISEIERSCFSPAWSDKSLLDELASQDTFFAVASDGRILGFCVARIAGDEAELYQIAVSENARRRGTAALLMEAVFRWAAASGAEKLFLEVRACNGPAVGLYEKTGFSVINIRKDYYSAPVEDALIMEKTIVRE
ncbi:MAG: ribosomal protein S18-alanine N-acetyltransferase [Oscillospiraceae bacterium]|nr:ribosomal protein S18-alanine N-acetyltransferase [Bacillota bacterium]MBR4232190.1 ribosomal protein S18-alanine N-acetyltransferase [Oscillospiraceae bacterium]